MHKRNTLFRCSVCGNITELVHVGGGTLSCCGQAMVMLEESTAETSTEKHVPFLSKTDSGYLVRVGEMQDHPMMDAHYILWIELITDKGSYRKFLKPGDRPEAGFSVGPGETVTGAREYCNLHGLWRG